MPRGRLTFSTASKDTLLELFADIEDTFYFNDDVRNSESVLYAIASSIASSTTSPKGVRTANSLGEVLRAASRQTADKKERRLLRKLGNAADELEDYADKSRYDGLADSQIEAADELREILHDGLVEWVESH